MDGDKQDLLAELRDFADRPREPQLDQRIDLLREALESKPPQNHNYPVLEAISFICLLVGILLVGCAAIVLAVSLAPTMLLVGSSERDLLPWLVQMGQTAMLSLSGTLGLIGFSFIVSSQVIQGALDLQGNADRHSFALHGIFHVLLAQRQDVIRDRAPK